MSRVQSRLRHAGGRPDRLQSFKRSPGGPRTRRKLGTSFGLIAPAQTLTLPTLDGVRTQFESSTGANVAAPLVRALIKKGLVREEHLRMAKSPADALGAILAEIVANNFSGAKDEFDINICVSDQLEDYREPEAVHKLNRSRSMYRLAVIGCGGTGSAVIGGLPFLHQALIAIGHPGLQVVVADGDKVSATNCVRQPFSESEIGLFKSTVLVNRLNLFWGLNWQASTEYVTRKTKGKIDILISCMDTRSARFDLVHSPLFKECAYWLDIGNMADGGQFILGQPKNNRNRRVLRRVPTVAELFPEIVSASLDQGDNLPSCSAVAALQRQEPFINQTLAYHALAMLARLFRHGEVAYHGGFVNLATGKMASLPIESRRGALYRRLNETSPMTA